MILFLSGNGADAVVLITVGMLVVLIADYLVRPLLIQGGTHLPFLAVLFGVFGGVITMGIVGLIIGPVLLVLLVVFFDEASHAHHHDTPESIN
jgi:predicted PurR-regulated permease PerM